MTETQRQAALGILAYFESGNSVPVDRAVIRADCSEVAALRAALAEPVQEPVVTLFVGVGDSGVGLTFQPEPPAFQLAEGEHRLYVSPQPPADVPMLTPEEITACWREADQGALVAGHGARFASAIQQAVRQKAGLK